METLTREVDGMDRACVPLKDGHALDSLGSKHQEDASSKAPADAPTDGGAKDGHHSSAMEDGITDSEASSSSKKIRKSNPSHQKDTDSKDGQNSHTSASADGSAKEDGEDEEEDSASDAEESSLSPDSSLRKAKPLLESVKKTLTAAAISAAQKTSDMSGIGGDEVVSKTMPSSDCTASPSKAGPSKGAAAATPTKGTPTPTKGTGASSNVPLVYKSPFLCSCGRNFDTKRGLSIHLAHEPEHTSIPNKLVDSATGSSTPTKSSCDENLPTIKKEEENDVEANSSPSSPPPSTAATNNATTSPSSPTLFNMAAFKPSARNPHYYSIIRTRRTSNIVEGEPTSSLPEQLPTKRTRAAGGIPGETATSSPAKGPSRTSDDGGEKSQTSKQVNDGLDGDSARVTEQKTKRKLRDSSEQKSQSGQQKATEEKKISSASPSHQVSKKAAAAAAVATSTGGGGSSSTGGTTLASTLQELGLRNSPVTRSNAASLKTPHEFISLPTNKKRGKKVWRGGSTKKWKDGSKQQQDAGSDDNMSEDVGEEFESPSTEARSSLKDAVRSSTRKEAARAASSDASASIDTSSNAAAAKNLDLSSDEASQQPQKRRRGRPPKSRSSAPSTPHGDGGGAAKNSPSSSGGAASNVTRSGKVHGRGGKPGITMTASSGTGGEEFDSEPAEESPLPLKSKSSSSLTGSKSSSSLQESSKKSGDKGKSAKTESASESTPTKLKKESSKSGAAASSTDSTVAQSSGKKADGPVKVLSGSKRSHPSDEKTPPVPRKRQRRRKSSFGSTRASKHKKAHEQEEEEVGHGEEEEEEEEEEGMEGEKEEPAEAASEDDLEEEGDDEEDEFKQSDRRGVGKKSDEGTSLAGSKTTRSKGKGGKGIGKSKAPAKSNKGKAKKKSEVEEPDTDTSMNAESKATDAAMTEDKKKDDFQEEKAAEDAASALPAAKIPVTQQRQSSVIVSVLSGPSEKPQQQPAPTQTQAGTAEQPVTTGSSNEGTNAEPAAKEVSGATSATSERDFRQPDQSQPPTAQMFHYPSSSPTTPTYGPFPPYPASFPPGPHHMMYHGPPPGHPAGMYPQQFYPYPGSQPMQIAPHPGQFMAPQPPMNLPAHPGTQNSGTPEQNVASPVMQQGQPQQTVQQQQQQQQQPQQPQQQHGVSYSSQPPPQSSPASTSAAVVATATATTVGGVRVSVVNDKPMARLPMVTLPYHMPSATPPRGPRPPPGPGVYSPMEMAPGIRNYMPGAGGPQSPEGLEPHQHMHPPHPLHQVYRPGMAPPMMGGYPAPHLHPSPYGAPMAIRMDHMAPYIDWPHEPRPPPAEETPAQPVKCPECNRMFKNNKALNGHMRLHGGFDWSKKHPYNSSNAQNNASSADGKQNQSAGSGASSSGTSASSPNEEGKPPSGPTSAKRKRSHSNSRSRSNSPTPGLVTKNRAKRKKSADDGSGVSSLTKENTAARGSVGGAPEAAGSVSSSAMEAMANLPVPREPSIFTFDSNSHISSSQRSLTSSINTGTQASENAGLGGSSLVHKGSTLDDLCRAAAELERMETTGNEEAEGSGESRSSSNGSGEPVEDEFGKKRPGNIVIPQTQSPSPAIDRDKYRRVGTPPYTPPPILSPSRSLLHLAPGVGPMNPAAPCTPNRILQHWTSRRTNDGRTVSETEETIGYAEPRINVGEEFQAKLPECDEARAGVSQDDARATLVWKPFEGMTQEDESVIEGYLELACSPSVGHGGRNKELAIHILHALGGSIKEAVKWLLYGRTPFDSNSAMGDYNYSGSNRWSGRERQQFRRAWKVHRKQFNMVRSAVESKKFPEVIEYYYTWKKYCSDEYRGRNRHISEEIFSDEDDIYAQIPSSSSSGSGDSSELAHDDNGRPFKSSKGKKNGEKYYGFSSVHGVGSNGTSANGQNGNHVLSGVKASMSSQSSSANVQSKSSSQGNFPIVYAPHSSPVPVSQQVHHFPCKYPGCNQVFTSIFALNGHIRIHGGSFYPKASSQPPSSSNHHSSSGSGGCNSNSAHPPQAHSNNSNFAANSHAAKLGGAHSHMPKSLVEIELAKTLLELPGPSCNSPSSSTSSIAKSMRYHTPSPKPSPGKGKSSSSKKKMASSSPGEREDFFPCNKCGRIFTKVKSRSAHMKSHIPKAT